MAPPSRNGPKPFRALAAVIVIMLVSVLGKETFSPRNWDHQVKAGLGLDLSSGTQVVLKAESHNGQPPASGGGRDEQCLRPVDGPGRGCTFPVTVSSLKQ